MSRWSRLRSCLALSGLLACTPKTAPKAEGENNTPTPVEPSEPSEPAPAPDSPRVERAFERVRSSQVAGFVNHDLDAYMAPWAPEGRVVIGRGPEPGPHDVVFDYAALRESKALRFSAPTPPDLTMVHELLGHELRDGLLTLRIQTTSGSPRSPEVMYETFQLEARDGQDWIVANRAWPHSLGVGRDAIEFTPEFWQRHDAEIAALVEADQLEEARELCSERLDLASWRRLAEQVAARPDAPASAWASLAYARLFTGRTAEAKQAAAKARELDPELELPLFSH